VRDNLRLISLTFSVLLLVSECVSGQAKQPTSLVVNGLPGEAPVVQVAGRSYVDIAALARITNGNLGFQGDRIVLSLPSVSGNSSATASVPEPAPETGLSRDFMKAGIEAFALMREWASPLAYAIQNGYPITEEWVAGYRESAAHGVRMASVAASTNDDRNALQLLTNEFESVREWSNKLVEARKSLNTAKYSMSESALRDDPLSQKIVSCGHFLASMLGSGSYQDNPSCH